MTILLWTLIVLLLGFGALGCFINKVPGPLAVFLAVVIAKLGPVDKLSLGVVLVVALLAILSFIASKLVKSSIQKLHTFSKRGGWGTTIGSIIGICALGGLMNNTSGFEVFFYIVLCLVVLPFVCSLLLELTTKNAEGNPIKRATAATSVYLVDTMLKLVVFAYAIYYMFLGES